MTSTLFQTVFFLTKYSFVPLKVIDLEAIFKTKNSFEEQTNDFYTFSDCLF
jgi:hypothetical protein